MSIRLSHLLITILTLLPGLLKGQDEIFVEIRGELRTVDGKPVSFAHVIDLSNRRGTSADYEGRFRIFTQPGDTLLFSAVGFQKATLAVPENLRSGTYPIKLVLQQDTIALPVAVITPWPESWEEFRQAFTALDIPNENASIEISDKALEQAIRDARPGGGIILPGPVSLLYDAFSREAKNRRRYENLQAGMQKFETIYRRLGHQALAEICHSGELDVMQAFIEACGLSQDLISGSSDLDLILALMRCNDCNEHRNQPK